MYADTARGDASEQRQALQIISGSFDWRDSRPRYLILNLPRLILENPAPLRELLRNSLDSFHAPHSDNLFTPSRNSSAFSNGELQYLVMLSFLKIMLLLTSIVVGKKVFCLEFSVVEFEVIKL